MSKRGDEAHTENVEEMTKEKETDRKQFDVDAGYLKELSIKVAVLLEV